MSEKVIFLVEDNQDDEELALLAFNQMVAVRKIEKFGHKMTVANNGKEALAALEKNASTGADGRANARNGGFEATQPSEPVGDETGRPMSHNRHDRPRDEGGPGACLAGGMDDYVSKPVQTAELRRRAGSRPVHGLCPRKRQPPRTVPGPLATCGPPSNRWAATSSSSTKSSPSSGRMATAAGRGTRAVNQGDAGGLRQAAHALKGSAGYVGAPTDSGSGSTAGDDRGRGEPGGGGERLRGPGAGVRATHGRDSQHLSPTHSLRRIFPMSVLSVGLPFANTAAPLATAPSGGTRVLVTDDLLLDRRMVERILERQGGWDVAFAGNGVEALAAMERERPTSSSRTCRCPGWTGLPSSSTSARSTPRFRSS